MTAGAVRRRRLDAQGFPWPLNCLGYAYDQFQPYCRATTSGMASEMARSIYASRKAVRS